MYIPTNIHSMKNATVAAGPLVAVCWIAALLPAVQNSKDGSDPERRMKKKKKSLPGGVIYWLWQELCISKERRLTFPAAESITPQLRAAACCGQKGTAASAPAALIQWRQQTGGGAKLGLTDQSDAPRGEGRGKNCRCRVWTWGGRGARLQTGCAAAFGHMGDWISRTGIKSD